MAKRPRIDDVKGLDSIGSSSGASAMPIPPSLPPPLALPLISPPSHQLVASGARTTTTVVSAQAVNASKLLRILEHHPNGMRQRDIHIAMNISAASLLPLLQALLNSKRVEVYQMQRPLPAVAAIDAQRAQTLANSDPSNKSLAIAAKEAHEAARNATLPPEIFYKSVSAEKAQQLADLTPDDQVVLQIIERHGNAGVWVRAIKQTSRFNQPQVTKIIKRLEGRKLIKAVKSVVYKWRKMYMLYDLEPAKQVTGGPWYTDQTLDVEYIAGLRKVVLEVLEKMNGIPVTAIDVSDYIEKGKISTIALAPRDIVVILDSLVYDGLCDYADGSLIRQQSLRLASMAMFPGSGTALQVGRNDATLASCIAEPKTHEEIEREITKREEVNDVSNNVDNTGAEEGIVARRMGVARALLVQSQEAKSRGRVILLKRGGAPESMIGLGGGFVRRAQLSSMLSASLTLEDKITKDDTEDEGEILNEGKRKGRRGNDEIGLQQSSSKLNATAITSKAHLKRKRRIEDSSEEEEEGKVDEDVDANDSEDSEELKIDEGGGADVEVDEEERGGDGGNAESNSDGDGVAEIKEGKDSSSRSKRPSTKIVYEDNDESDANDDNKEVVNDDEVDEEGKESERGDGKKRSNRIKNNESRIGLLSASGSSKRTEDEQVSRRGYVLVKGGRGGSVDHITSTPCGVCPVAAKCEPGGLISPTSCIYISQWMEF